MYAPLTTIFAVPCTFKSQKKTEPQPKLRGNVYAAFYSGDLQWRLDTRDTLPEPVAQVLLKW